MRLAQVDRTLFELLRKQLIALDYLPDVSQFSTTEAYTAAKQNIIDAGGQVVELFGVGSLKSKEGKTLSKITIERINTPVGGIGSNNTFYFDKVTVEPDVTYPEGYYYNKLQRPDGTFDVVYQIRCICDKSLYERIMFDSVLSVLGQRRDLSVFDDINLVFTSDSIFCTFEDYLDVSVKEFIEHIFRYRIRDVWLQEDTVVSKSKPINTVDFEIWTVPSGKSFIEENASDIIHVEFD